MAPFDKIPSGLSGLDRALDWMRLGDNVVWQVSSVDEYRRMAEPFATQALSDGRKLIYIRFAPHPPILEPRNGLIIHHLDPSLGFEHFTGNVHSIIAKAGKDAFYVFDCLSELQTAWAADLMMGNFFVVTCPYLFELDTVAWFCLIRHRHSYDTIARIRETTQLLLDLYPDEENMYIHPLKVWKRYSPTMFFPHHMVLSAPDEILPLTDGVSVSRFYQLIGQNAIPGDGQNLDNWERFFMQQREQLSASGGTSQPVPRPLAERLLGHEKRLIDLACRTCSVEDMLTVKDRMIGSGKIGGKSAGMIIARRIVAKQLPGLTGHIEPHDSFYLGSDVFYTYLVHNKLWKLRIQQRKAEGYFSKAEELRNGILAGTVPDKIREQCLRMLEYFGQNPIIVRSSSLLEDSFGHAFAGKYESIFCVNTGSPEDRMAAFENALKRVYASTMDTSALAYRQQRGLQGKDEQMAILVQRVSGSLFGDFFMPAAAGVGHSFNNWRWHRELDPAAGMIRLVLGLGTRAVERTGSDYPRLVSLDRPELISAGPGGLARYCQRSVDGLSLTSYRPETRTLDELVQLLPEWLKPLLIEHDTEVETRLAESGQRREIWLGTCSGLINKVEVISDLGTIMKTLQKEYGTPVDIEFTINCTADGKFMINLLQCRPLQAPAIIQDSSASRIDDKAVAAIPTKDIFMYLRSGSMGPQMQQSIDAVIMVNPRLYYEMPYRNKPSVARIVGRLNNHYREQGKAVMLLAPGRIGTTSPELGLPVSFAEISGMKILCELACSEAGYQPELSYGSHFFQDLVEAEIFYCAVSEDPSQTVFHPEFMKHQENLINSLIPDHGIHEEIISVYEPHDLIFFSDVVQGSCLCARITR